MIEKVFQCDEENGARVKYSTASESLRKSPYIEKSWEERESERARKTIPVIWCRINRSLSMALNCHKPNLDSVQFGWENSMYIYLAIPNILFIRSLQFLHFSPLSCHAWKLLFHPLLIPCSHAFTYYDRGDVLFCSSTLDEIKGGMVEKMYGRTQRFMWCLLQNCENSLQKNFSFGEWPFFIIFENFGFWGNLG